MTFREYWTALGFGALSPKARAFLKYAAHREDDEKRRADSLQADKIYLSRQLHLVQAQSDQRAWKMLEATDRHLDYAKKLADSLLQKNSIRPLMPVDAPKRDPKPRESAGGLAALGEEYDKVQEEDRLKYGPVIEEESDE